MEHLSEERIAEIREDGMLLSDFRIGMIFWMSGGRWRCTDIGRTRLVIAIKLDMDDDPSWYDGPPYAVCEHTIDQHDFTACSLTRYDGNSESYTDEEVERIRNSGMADIVEHRGKILPEVLERIQVSRAHAARKGKGPTERKASYLPTAQNLPDGGGYVTPVEFKTTFDFEPRNEKSAPAKS
jgi:hypothetical protein